MQQKSDPHIFSGMQRDTSISKHKAESLYDAMNIRFTARDGDTLLSITNEKGTLQLDNLSMEGTYLGHCVINNYVVVFTHGDEDIIYRIYPDVAEPEVLYHGNLGFSIEHPIETLGVYENDNIQKVYWTDGNKQPRMINVGNVKYDSNNDTQFDFVATLDLDEDITVTRKEGSGTFAPGTIQYAFSYYNKYGRQSNIFYTSLLQYISYPDRAGSPEDRISNCFEINVKNLQMDFDYLRVYSIHRTSENAVPTVKRIIDIELSTVKNRETTFSDDGEIGDTIDPTELLYIGGEEILAQTITQKDNTLFLGNLELIRRSISDDIKNYLSTIDPETLQPKQSSDVHISYEEFLKGYNLYKVDSPNGYYNYVSSLNWSSPGFKIREHYRLGVQFQHESGKWSEPVFIGDYTMDGLNQVNPNITTDSAGNYVLQEPCIRINLNLAQGNGLTTWLETNGYKKVRPVVVFPTIEDRLVLTQGMLCPTVFSKAARKNKTPFSQSSWFLRPNILGSNPDRNNSGYNTHGNFAEYRHFMPISNVDPIDNTYISRAGEIQGAENEDAESKHFYVDQSIVTMHSPDIEWDNSFYNLNYTKWKLNIIGAIEFTASVGAIDIQTSTPSSGDTQGFINKTFGSLNRSKDAGRSLLAGMFWNDGVIRHIPAKNNDPEKYETINHTETVGTEPNEIKSTKVLPFDYLIYPWHRTGSLNNDEVRSSDAGTRTAVLKQKKISNLKFSDLNLFFQTSNITSYDISPIQLFASDQVSLIKLPFNDPKSSLGNISYYGNVDTLLNGKTNFYIGEDFNSVPFKVTSSANITVMGTTVGTFNIQTIEEGSAAVRMKYKSTKHLVFSLNSNSDGNVVCLPTLNSTYNGTGDMSPNDMFWLAEDAPTIRLFKTIDYTCEGNPNTITSMQDGSTLLDIGQLILDTTNSRIYEVTALKETEVGLGQTSAEILDHNVFSSYNTKDGLFVYNSTYYKGDQDYINGHVQQMDATEVEDVERNVYHIDQGRINENPQYPYLLLGELYRDDVDSLNAFNGKSNDAIKSNLWIPAGEPVKLSDSDTVEFTQGDTWYTRYDCLKTYPFTMEDENSIIEIGSFLCESRINGDGRYDRNRGQISNLMMSPINFNLLNPVYNNKDNFFNYRVLDDDYYDLNKFSNQITWSKEKQMAADVDLWTNITMANTFDLDGTMGSIQALRTWQDTIYCFQDNAISVISFNPRVQIPTSDGVPIEISNSYKLEGKVYISDSIGCNNKQTIAVTPSGIYFVDPNSKEFYHIAGKELSSISASHGFSDWFKHSNITHTFYDKNRNDVYVLGNDDNSCIVYSELLGQFTSFMSYNGTPAMFNIHNDFYAFRNNDTLDMYKMFAGQYNDFFGDIQPFYIHFISNADSGLDKIFSTIETRVDFRDANGVVHDEFFDYLKVWNEYQTAEKNPLTVSISAFRADAKKKFRIWRVNIPRCGRHNLERIRNTWTNIKLGKNSPGNLKMELHDLNVQYFI